MDKIDWIRDVVYLLPIAGIIWKGALMSAKIKENAKEIEECKTVIQKQNDAIIESLNRLTNTMNDIKTDVSVLKALRDNELGSKRSRVKKAD